MLTNIAKPTSVCFPYLYSWVIEDLLLHALRELQFPIRIYVDIRGHTSYTIAANFSRFALWRLFREEKENWI